MLIKIKPNSGGHAGLITDINLYFCGTINCNRNNFPHLSGGIYICAHLVNYMISDGGAQQMAVIDSLFHHDKNSSPSVRLLIRQQAVTVLASKQAMVIGPTPPGTGVMAPATAAQLS